MLIYLMVTGLTVGFSIAAPVGVIGLFCIQQTLKGGVRLGITSGLGAATADMMYGIAIALGFEVSHAVLIRYHTPLPLIGGLFLCYFGVKKFFSRPSFDKVKSVKDSLLGAYIAAFLLTLTNHVTILDFIGLFIDLNVDVAGFRESLSFVGGVFVGSASWWFLLCFAVGIFRERISEKVLRYIHCAAGMVIFTFGIYALSDLWK